MEVSYVDTAHMKLRITLIEFLSELVSWCFGFPPLSVKMIEFGLAHVWIQENYLTWISRLGSLLPVVVVKVAPLHCFPACLNRTIYFSLVRGHCPSAFLFFAFPCRPIHVHSALLPAVLTMLNQAIATWMARCYADFSLTLVTDMWQKSK